MPKDMPPFRKVKSTKVSFPKPEATEQYERPLGPERPSVRERFESHPIVGGAKAIASRIIQRDDDYTAAPARKARRGRAKVPRSPNYGSTRGSMPWGGGQLPDYDVMDFMPPDMYSGSGLDVGAQAPGHGKPRRSRKRDDFTDPYYIPPHIRHLF